MDRSSDPGRGYFASQLVRGVQRISTGGVLQDYYPTSRAALALALDEGTGDLYVSLAWGPSADRSKIVRLPRADDGVGRRLIAARPAVHRAALGMLR